MIAWHALELQVLRDQLTPQGCTILAPYSIGEQPLEIDAVVRIKHLFDTVVAGASVSSTHPTGN